MNRTPLLIVSFTLNAVLLAIIGWLVRAEPSELLPSAQSDLESKYPQTVMTTVSRATIEPREEADPAHFDGTPAGESGAATPARAGRTEPGVDRGAQIRYQGSPTADAASVPRRLIPKQAPLRFAVQRGMTSSANTTGRAPAAEIARGLHTDRPEATAAKGTSREQPVHSATLTETVSTPSTETVIVPTPENPTPRNWPTGPYTPEEQAYRQQYGWATFAAALREREFAQGAE